MHTTTTDHVAYVITQPKEALILYRAVCESPQGRRLYDISEKSKCDCRAPELLTAIDSGEVRRIVLTRDAATRLAIRDLPDTQDGLISVWPMQFMLADRGHLYCRGHLKPSLSKEAIALFGSREPIEPANTMGPQGSICELAKERLRPSLESSPAGAATTAMPKGSVRSGANGCANDTPKKASMIRDAYVSKPSQIEEAEAIESGMHSEPCVSRLPICRLLRLGLKKRRKRRRRDGLLTKSRKRKGERCIRINVRICKRDLAIIKAICPEGVKLRSWAREILLGEDPIKLALRMYRATRASLEGNVSNNEKQICRRTADADMASQSKPCLLLLTQARRFSELIGSVPPPRPIQLTQNTVKFEESGFDDVIRIWVSKDERLKIDERSGCKPRGRSEWARHQFEAAVNRVRGSCLDTESSNENIRHHGKAFNEIAKTLNTDRKNNMPSDARQASLEIGNIIDKLELILTHDSKGETL